MNSLEKTIKQIDILKSKLDRYIKQKADFLAEISSEPLATTKSTMFYQEVILPLIMNSQFMDTIAANEGIRYKNNNENRLKMRFFVNKKELTAEFSCMEKKEHKDRKPPIYTYPSPLPEYPYSCTCDLGHELTIISIKNRNEDIEIELPGPLGEFAIYGFLENFIRNAAKHQSKNLKQDENLEIFIQVLEDTNHQEFYKVRIWDNITDPDEELNIEIEGKKCKTLQQMITAYIESSIIKNTGELKKQAWGIAEMKINSTLLYGSVDSEKMNEKLEAKSIPRSKLPAKDVSGKALVYEFKLMKSKFAYILTKDISAEENINLVKYGIKVFNSLTNFKTEFIQAESFASPKFVIIDCNALNDKDINELENLKPFMPFRIIVINNKLSERIPGACIASDNPIVELNKVFSLDEVDRWKEKIWDMWIKHIIQLTQNTKVHSQKVCLHIYLEQNLKEGHTKSWTIFADKFNKKEFCAKVKVWRKDGGYSDSEGNEQFLHIGYDRHGGMRLVVPKHILDNINPKINIDKLSSDFVHLFTEDIRLTLPFELAEALLLRVAVADDRLAEKSGEMIKIEDSRELWRWGLVSKVYFISHLKCNKKEIPVHSSVNDGVKYSKSNKCKKYIFDLDESKFDFPIQMLIIHQGLIDNLKLSKEQQEELLLNIQKKIPFLIVDSGRGIPPTLSDEVKFLPYSLLEQYLTGGISKYCLIRTCMSLTRRKEK